MEQKQYRTTREWEDARPFNAVFQGFFYANTSQVKKVIGHVDLIQKNNRNMHPQVVRVPVKWDHLGRAYCIRNNQRMSDNDIIFD